MTPERRVREQIIEAIRNDLDGRGEYLMKEVWESLDTEEERVLVYAEMRRIIELLT